MVTPTASPSHNPRTLGTAAWLISCGTMVAVLLYADIRVVSRPEIERAVAKFDAVDLAGTRVRLRDYRGQLVLLNFWATWCAPCRTEIPQLLDLGARYSARLRIVSVSEDQDIEAVRKFVSAMDIRYPVVMSDSDIHSLFPDVQSLPTSLLMDANGKLVAQYIGAIHLEEVERDIGRAERR